MKPYLSVGFLAYLAISPQAKPFIFPDGFPNH